MTTVAEVQAAADKLSVAGRVQLLEHLAQDDTVRRKQLARLRAMIAEGERDHAEGRFIEITSAVEHRAFFDDIKRRGRARLKRTA